MRYFKTEAYCNARQYEINTDNFTTHTGNKRPYVQKNNNTVSLYAVCPSCLNPIQIVGLAKKTKVKPYGKHTGKDIGGLPEWNFQKYQYCPYAKPGTRIAPNMDYDNTIIDEQAVELYNLSREQFDRIVYIMSKELGMRFSSEFLKKCIKTWCNNQFYTYPWLTEANLPYIFAYLCAGQYKIYGQSVYENTPIYNNLIKHPDVNLQPIHNKKDEETGYFKITNKPGKFIQMETRFTNHVQRAVQGEELKESMLFCIDVIRNPGQKNEQYATTIHEQQIDFKETWFINMINNHKNNKKRDSYLLKLAGDNMENIHII